ncbi:porin family protein [Bradyrhizobium diazoefficiens]|nr:porin family protein [Bradyrhizobium diazoefficiens]QQN61584.1 porin family protein [Bradyrhizobium diazoefficiens]
MKITALKIWALATISPLALGALAPANGADLPLYGKAPLAPILAYDWTGIYGGINGGGGLAHACWSIVGVAGVPIDPPVGEGCHNASGGTVGGQLGYRWQKAHWVLGMEGQGNWADFKGSNVSLALAPLDNRTKIDSFGLFTGQFGYTVNSLLFYGKAGAAVAQDKYDMFIPGVAGVVSSTLSQTRWGYSAGFGVEYAFAENWSVGGEYDHLFLGHHGGDFAAIIGPPVRTDRIGQDIDIGLIRLNYRWGGPIVAK